MCLQDGNLWGGRETMETLTAVEDEFVERRLAACIERNNGGEKKWSMYGRARLTRRFDYWTDALECHRAGRDHDGVEGMRKEYAKRMKDAVRSGRPVGEAVACSEPYRKAVENRRRYKKGKRTSFANGYGVERGAARQSGQAVP